MQISIPDGHISCARIHVRRLYRIPVHENMEFYGQTVQNDTPIHENTVFHGQITSKSTLIHENRDFYGQDAKQPELSVGPY